MTLLVGGDERYLGDDVVLVLQDEAALSVVLVPVELYHQRLLIQVQFTLF